MRSKELLLSKSCILQLIWNWQHCYCFFLSFGTSLSIFGTLLRSVKVPSITRSHDRNNDSVNASSTKNNY